MQLGPSRCLLIAALLLLGACGGASTRAERAPMAEPGDGLTLTLALRPGVPERLLPEQDLQVDIVLRNGAAVPAEALDLDANPSTPVILARDAVSGRGLVEVSHEAMLERFTGGFGEPVPGPPAVVSLAPGASVRTFFNLWAYADPFPRGSYEVLARHQAAPQSSTWITSNRLAFSVVDASVRDAAVGYEDAQRGSSLVLWIALASGEAQGRLLGRVSAPGQHRAARFSGVTLGPAAADARLAISAKPPEGATAPAGWFAVVSGREAEVIHHFRAAARARVRLALPLDAAVPVSGFPDRGHAVFLAAGRAAGGGALAGAVIAPGAGAVTPWTVALPETPTRAVAAFGPDGPIAVLMLSEEGSTSRLWRVDVDESGAVTRGPRAVRGSARRILALAADQRPGQTRAFVALEADPATPARLTVLRIPAGGGLEERVLEVAGWPRRDGRPLAPARVNLEIAWDGVPVVAIVDEAGNCHAGRLDGTPLALLATAERGPRVVAPHVAALRRTTTFSGFTDTGRLVHLGVR